MVIWFFFTLLFIKSSDFQLLHIHFPIFFVSCDHSQKPVMLIPLNHSHDIELSIKNYLLLSFHFQLLEYGHSHEICIIYCIIPALFAFKYSKKTLK